MTSTPGRAAAPGADSPAIRYHDGLAEGWTERYASGGFRRRAEFFSSEILPKLEIAGDWIDVGCGSGVFTRLLAGAGADAIGIDGSSAMISAARGVSVQGRTPRYEVRNVEDLSEQGAFDGALLLSVLEYLDDPAQGLVALGRLLRPGGTMILSAPNRLSGVRRLQGFLRAASSQFGSKAFAYLASSRTAWSRAELAALIETHGFSCETILGFDPVAPRPLWPIVSPSLWFAVCRKQA